MDKKRTSTGRIILVLLVFMLAFAMLSAFSGVSADSAGASDDVRDDVEVKKLEQNINDLTKKQQAIKDELSSIRNDIDGLLEKKARYDELVEVSESKIDASEQLISELTLQAEQIQAKIDEKRAESEKLYEQIKERIVVTYESGGVNMSYIEMVFGAKSLPDFLFGISNAATLLEYDTKLMNDYESAAADLESEIARLNEAISKQAAMKESLEAEKAEFETLLAQSEKLLLDAMKDADMKEDVMHRLEEEEEAANKRLEDFIDELLSQKNKPVETDPPETKPPETKPPETKPPETKPPETKPPETKPPKTEPPETTGADVPPETEPPVTDGQTDTEPPSTEDPGDLPSTETPPETFVDDDPSAYLWPLDPQYTHITSYFGKREDPFNPGSGVITSHGGTDIYAPRGANIYASRTGTVVKAEKDDSYGNYIMIDHGDGYFTLYAHCSKLIAKVGDYVKKGEKIAEVGNTGHVTGYHLHFEVRYGKTRLDALDFVDIPKN